MIGNNHGPHTSVVVMWVVVISSLIGHGSQNMTHSQLWERSKSTAGWVDQERTSGIRSIRSACAIRVDTSDWRCPRLRRPPARRRPYRGSGAPWRSRAAPGGPSRARPAWCVSPSGRSAWSWCRTASSAPAGPSTTARRAPTPGRGSPAPRSRPGEPPRAREAPSPGRPARRPPIRTQTRAHTCTALTVTAYDPHKTPTHNPLGLRMTHRFNYVSTEFIKQ